MLFQFPVRPFQILTDEPNVSLDATESWKEPFESLQALRFDRCHFFTSPRRSSDSHLLKRGGHPRKTASPTTTKTTMMSITFVYLTVKGDGPTFPTGATGGKQSLTRQPGKSKVSSRVRARQRVRPRSTRRHPRASPGTRRSGPTRACACLFRTR